jgi:pilus assembly protein FimV
MLQAQLQQTKEDLAARDQQVQELQSRVADLEKLRSQQQQLIALKDNALADAQKNLATTGKATPPPAGTVPAWQWVAGVAVAVLVAGLLGWALGRRRDRDLAPRLKQRFDSADMAAAMPAAASVRIDALADDAGPMATSAVADPVTKGTPTWHAPAMPASAPIAADIALAQQRLEAAQVLLDQGDAAAARVLLHEVLAGRDPAAREQAARMLRDLD